MLYATVIRPLSILAGAPPDQVALILALLLAYPLSALIPCLPASRPALRHAYCILAGAFLFLYVCDQSLYAAAHLVLGSLASYLILIVIGGRWGATLALVLAMAHMAYTHIERMADAWGSVVYDHSGPQMVLTIKLTSLAWNVYDGSRPSKSLSTFQRTHAVHGPPSLLAFAGYLCYPAGLLAGPACEFAEYDAYIRGDLFPAKASPPSAFRPALFRFITGILYLAAFVFISPYLPDAYIATAAYAAHSLPFRFLYLQLAMLNARLKYYAVWTLAEGACVASGFGFNGYGPEGTPRWDRLVNIRPWAVESAQSVKAYSDNWNIATNLWLRNYVYLRIVPESMSTGLASKGSTSQLPLIDPTMATFVVSAIWHGFYPGYYLAFITAALALSTGRQLRRTLRPRVLAADSRFLSFLYNMLGWFFTTSSLNYVAVAFQLLGFRDTIFAWNAVGFYVHVAMIALAVALKMLLPRAPYPPSHDPAHIKRAALPVVEATLGLGIKQE